MCPTINRRPELAVRKRKDIDKWEVSLNLDGKRIRRTSPIQTKKGAKEYETELIQQHVASLTSKSYCKKETQLKEFAIEWLKTYVAVNNKPSSIYGKESILRLHLLPYFGDFNLDGITAHMIEQYKALKLKTLSPKTINNHLTVLRKLMTTAEDWDYEVKVPVIKWFSAKANRTGFLKEEKKALFLASVDKEWLPMVLTALNTGMRQGELIALEWSDIDFARNTISVARSDWKGIVGVPKNGCIRDIPMNRALSEVLRKHRQSRSSRKYVFCKKDGSKLTYTGVRWGIWRACDKAGLDRFQWHHLRHSFASHLVMAGVGLRQVQELMGHKTLEMTMRYAHLDRSSLANAVEKLTDVEIQEKTEPDLKVVKGSA